MTLLRGGRSSRVVAIVATWAMIVALSAQCLASDEMTPEQRACCASMSHDCGNTAIAQECCPPQSAQLESPAPAADLSRVAAPDAIVIAVLPDPGVVAVVASAAAASSLLVRPPGVATHLLDSLFRI